MNDRAFSLQPRPAARRGPQSIADFIQRMNAEPGGFRGLNAAELRRQIEARRSGADRDDDIDMTGGASSEVGSEVTEIKDIAIAREELLRAIHQTHQTSMFGLDFVSLLLSKESPAQAVATFSPGLRDMIGVGTLGATMLEAPTPLTQSRVPDNMMVVIGKRLIDLNKAADTALAASKRLQQEIVSETKYWSEVLAVSEHGWRTFRLPHEPHTMGVKFGFSNAASEFKANSIAPLRRAEDGSVALEHGRMGGGSKRLQVSILEDGVALGRSSLPRPLPADAPLQDRVQESRDTIFAQELWHEINREGRTMLTRNVRLEKSAVTYKMDARRTISLRLATLGEADAPGIEQPGPQDVLAESLYLALCLLLSNAHRTNEQKRAESSVNRVLAPTYSILAPIISYYEYDKSIELCVQSFSAFANVLRSAGLNASVMMKQPPLSSLPGAPASEALAAVLLRPPPVQFDLTITPESRLRVLLKLNPLYGTVFSVFCLPPPQRESANPLLTICPPGAEEYDRAQEVFWYLYRAVPRALTAHYRTMLKELSPAAPAGSQSPTSFAVHASNKGLVDHDSEEYGVHFDFDANPKTGHLELHVTGELVEDGNRVHGEWTWPAPHGQAGGESNLDAVVRHVLSNGPTR